MFVTRASERAFPPRDFPTVLALSSAVALIEIVKSFMGASIVFFNSQLSRDSCRVMRKCSEFRLICIHRQKFRLIWLNRDIIETIKCSFCSCFCPFGLFCSCFRFFLRLRVFPFLFVPFLCGLCLDLLLSIDLFRLLRLTHFRFPHFLISSIPRADNPTNPTRLKKTMWEFSIYSEQVLKIRLITSTDDQPEGQRIAILWGLGRLFGGLLFLPVASIGGFVSSRTYLFNSHRTLKVQIMDLSQKSNKKSISNH